MSRAAYAAENIIQQNINELGCAGSLIAAVAGISQSRWSAVMNGQKDFGAQEGEQLKGLTARLIDIRDAVKPLPLGLRDAQAVRGMLDMMDRTGVTLEQLRASIENLFQK